MVTKQLAGCVITDETGKVLLIHRKTPRLTQWELAGGKVEPGESLSAAAAREVFEELGVQVKISREIGTKNFEHDGINWEYHWFLADIISGRPAIMEPDKFDDFAYVNIFDPAADKRDAFSINIVNLVAYLKDINIHLSV